MRAVAILASGIPISLTSNENENLFEKSGGGGGESEQANPTRNDFNIDTLETRLKLLLVRVIERFEESRV